MRVSLCFLFALACTPEQGALEPWFGDDDGTDLLGDDLEDAFGQRTRLYDDPGAARLTHDGEPLTGETQPGDWVGDLVVVDHSDQVRVAWETEGFQLLLWLERIDLADVVAVRTEGLGSPDAPAGAGFVLVPAGLDVPAGDPVEGRVLVEWEAWSPHSTLLVSAWVATADVDQVYDLDPNHVAESEIDALLDGPILDRPHGDVLAVSIDHARIPVEHSGEPVDGWWHVAWSNGDTRVEGWAYEDDLSPPGLFTFGFGCGGCSGNGRIGWGRHADLVPANTPMRAEPGGPVVARTTRTVYIPGISSGSAWHHVGTPWGDAGLWVDLAEVRGD